jgi:predicted DNA-binding transcriptional regulator AlpA
MESHSLSFVYLSADQVCNVGPIRSKSALYRAIRDGKAPEPDRVGGRSLWRSDRIDVWLRDVAAEADRERQARAERAGESQRRRLEGIADKRAAA